MKKLIPLILIIVILVLGFVFLKDRLPFGSQNQQANQPVPSETTDLTAPSPESQVPVPDTWETYTASAHDFLIRYPEDLKVSDNPQAGIVFTKIGSTQTQGTELFDGFMITLRQGTYTQESLPEFVKAKHAEIKSEPATHGITEIQPTTVAGISGYTFNVRGLGEFQHYYLPSGEGEYLLLVAMVADPENMGYEQTVETMLASLEITDRQ